MTDRRTNRRRVLQVGGLAVLGAVAGCSGSDGTDENDTDENDTSGNDTSGNDTSGNDTSGNDTDENETDNVTEGSGSVPSYADYVTLNENDQFTLTYADIASLRGLESFDTGGDTENSGMQSQDIGDALLSTPIGGYFLLYFGGSFTLSAAGLSPLVEAMQSSQFDSGVDEYFTVGNTTVLRGDIETDEISQTITTVPEESQGFFRVPYEQTGEYGGYTLYSTESSGSTTGSNTTAQTVGVSGDAVVMSSRSAVERTIDAATGASPSAADRYDEFAQLLSTANGHITFGVYGPDGYENTGSGETGTGSQNVQFEQLQESKGFLGSLTFLEDGGGSAVATALFEGGIDEAIRSETRDAFGSKATSSSFDFGNERLTVTGEYSAETIRNLNLSSGTSNN